MLEPTRQSLCCPQPKHGPTLCHKNVKREEKSENEDRTSDPPPANPNPYRAAIKADMYRKAAQVCYIPNTITYSGVHRGYLPPSVAGSFQICKICFFSYGEVL